MSASKWSSNLFEIFYNRAVIVEAFKELSEIWWYVDDEPQKIDHKFDFQFVGYAKNHIESITDLEELLVLHAEYILKHARDMIYDPHAREDLRHFDLDTKIYWSPTVRDEKDRETNMTFVQVKPRRRNSEESV